MVVMCWEGEHLPFAALAGLGILLYPFGMPAFLFILLCKADKSTANDKYRFLKSLRDRFRRGRRAVEVLQLAFKVFWAGVLIFVGRGTPLQMSICVASTVLYLLLLAILQPYQSNYDNMLWVAGFVKLFFTTWVGQQMLIGEEMPGGLERTIGISPESAGRCLVALDVALFGAVAVATVVELCQERRPTSVLPVSSATNENAEEERGIEMQTRTGSDQPPNPQLEAKASAPVRASDDNRPTSRSLAMVAPAAADAAVAPAAAPAAAVATAARSMEQRIAQQIKQQLREELEEQMHVQLHQIQEQMQLKAHVQRQLKKMNMTAAPTEAASGGSHGTRSTRMAPNDPAGSQTTGNAQSAARRKDRSESKRTGRLPTVPRDRDRRNHDRSGRRERRDTRRTRSRSPTMDHAAASSSRSRSPHPRPGVEAARTKRRVQSPTKAPRDRGRFSDSRDERRMGSQSSVVVDAARVDHDAALFRIHHESHLGSSDKSPDIEAAPTKRGSESKRPTRAPSDSDRFSRGNHSRSGQQSERRTVSPPPQAHDDAVSPFHSLSPDTSPEAAVAPMANQRGECNEPMARPTQKKKVPQPRGRRAVLP